MPCEIPRQGAQCISVYLYILWQWQCMTQLYYFTTARAHIIHSVCGAMPCHWCLVDLESYLLSALETWNWTGGERFVSDPAPISNGDEQRRITQNVYIDMQSKCKCRSYSTKSDSLEFPNSNLEAFGENLLIFVIDLGFRCDVALGSWRLNTSLI